MKTSFFDPATTNLDTVVFGPGDWAVQIVANAPKTWCITNDVSNDSINAILHDFFKIYPKATLFSVQEYDEHQFFEMWRGDDTSDF